MGLGVVHTSHQSRVAAHCGVSRVPSIVAVIMGRVVHFNGWFNDPREVKNFLKNSLPSSVVTMVGVVVHLSHDLCTLTFYIVTAYLFKL